MPSTTGGGGGGDKMAWGPIIAAGVQLAGGLLNSRGARQANQMSRESLREQMQQAGAQQIAAEAQCFGLRDEQGCCFVARWFIIEVFQGVDEVLYDFVGQKATADEQFL